MAGSLFLLAVRSPQGPLPPSPEQPSASSRVGVGDGPAPQALVPAACTGCAGPPCCLGCTHLFLTPFSVVFNKALEKIPPPGPLSLPSLPMLWGIGSWVLAVPELKLTSAGDRLRWLLLIAESSAHGCAGSASSGSDWGDLCLGLVCLASCRGRGRRTRGPWKGHRLVLLGVGRGLLFLNLLL